MLANEGYGFPLPNVPDSISAHHQERSIPLGQALELHVVGVRVADDHALAGQLHVAVPDGARGLDAVQDVPVHHHAARLVDALQLALLLVVVPLAELHVPAAVVEEAGSAVAHVAHHQPPLVVQGRRQARPARVVPPGGNVEVLALDLHDGPFQRVAHLLHHQIQATSADLWRSSRRGTFSYSSLVLRTVIRLPFFLKRLQCPCNAPVFKNLARESIHYKITAPASTMTIYHGIETGFS
mmetsp:Transcript_22542/g.35433  ORF Transcript_22542/g.35433 Transcript_22542/m.35433 type:complete len:239 (+) Transcript_22542:194-910(+)